MLTQPSSPDADGPYWQMPTLEHDDRLIGGVAAGIGRELGLDPLWVRVGFLLLFSVAGWGAIIYGICWLIFTLVPSPSVAHRHPKAVNSTNRHLGFLLVVGGLVLLAARLGGFRATLMWPLAVFDVGLVITLRQINRTGPIDLWGKLQIALGAVICSFAIVMLVVMNSTLGGLGTIVVAGFGLLIGGIVLSAPWWLRLLRQLDTERSARVRSDERADVAAHLHDSVLQTLTLIQKNDDPQAMANLARRQERELRNWLDPNRASRRGHSVRGQLDELATDVEQLHGVNVEIVAVGDCIVTEPVAAALAAVREAAVNAAKHSGAPRVDVYAEIRDDAVDFFVRDTGVGFDRSTVPADRLGLAESIEGRMERAGGSVQFFTAPGEGTEVEISIPRSPDPEQPTTDPKGPTP